MNHKKYYCKNCGKIKEEYAFISSAVWGGIPYCNPNDPSFIGVC